eukprot:TRINITY_DN37310_c0_g1_i1.p1 TRINITY_DN37310_c0_g1~~TRINITY_DN37310_c0_g1_i1.p1  ORF type:complete len:375 (-),score=114.14 TRINITY_DN37310_c0_g1_i1:599-1723(-)
MPAPFAPSDDAFGWGSAVSAPPVRLQSVFGDSRGGRSTIQKRGADGKAREKLRSPPMTWEMLNMAPRLLLRTPEPSGRPPEAVGNIPTSLWLGGIPGGGDATTGKEFPPVAPPAEGANAEDAVGRPALAAVSSSPSRARRVPAVEMAQVPKKAAERGEGGLEEWLPKAAKTDGAPMVSVVQDDVVLLKFQTPVAKPAEGAAAKARVTKKPKATAAGKARGKTKAKQEARKGAAAAASGEAAASPQERKPEAPCETGDETPAKRRLTRKTSELEDPDAHVAFSASPASPTTRRRKSSQQEKEAPKGADTAEEWHPKQGKPPPGWTMIRNGTPKIYQGPSGKKCRSLKEIQRFLQSEAAADDRQPPVSKTQETATQ